MVYPGDRQTGRLSSETEGASGSSANANSRQEEHLHAEQSGTRGPRASRQTPTRTELRENGAHTAPRPSAPHRHLRCEHFRTAPTLTTALPHSRGSRTPASWSHWGLEHGSTLRTLALPCFLNIIKRMRRTLPPKRKDFGDPLPCKTHHLQPPGLKHTGSSS